MPHTSTERGSGILTVHVFLALVNDEGVSTVLLLFLFRVFVLVSISDETNLKTCQHSEVIVRQEITYALNGSIASKLGFKISLSSLVA